MAPQLSVLMTVYNAEKYVRETIDSILCQSYTDFEFIIVDDGSCDGSSKIIESFSDSRITFYKLPKNVGHSAALNYGIGKARGKYLAKVDADDIYHRERFEKQIEFLELNPHISVVDSYITYFPDSYEVEQTDRFKYHQNIHEKQINEVVNNEEFKEKLYWFSCLIHSAMMVKTDVLKRNAYNENMRNLEDYELFYRLNKMGIGFSKVPLLLVNVRVTNNSNSVNERSLFVEFLLKIKKEELDLFFSKNHNVYIWGTGEFGKDIFEECSRNALEIKGFLDSNKKGTYLGKPIVNLEDLKPMNDKIIVASTYGKGEINKILKSNKFEHIRDFIIMW